MMIFKTLITARGGSKSIPKKNKILNIKDLININCLTINRKPEHGI